MKKDFKIGDKVKFIKSNDFGTVKNVISERKLEIEDSSGFLSIVNKIDLIPFDKLTNSVSSYGDLNCTKDHLSTGEKKIKVKSNQCNEIRFTYRKHYFRLSFNDKYRNYQSASQKMRRCAVKIYQFKYL